MQESFLHYVWLTGLFDVTNLRTNQNQQISIIKRGQPHQDSGPDFIHAQLKIGNQLWAGHVEIHVKSSEWFDHGHQYDKAYDTTILHVCYEHDADVFRSNGTMIPCLELNHRIDSKVINRYENLVHTVSDIPCSSVLKDVDHSVKLLTLESMMAERFNKKSNKILTEASNLEFDWNELFYRQLCRTMGLRINQEPFDILGRSLPYSTIVRYQNKPAFLEALIFGMAGFLSSQETPCNAYHNQLISDFNFLKQKHQLQPMPLHVWKFLRLRPANFPTIRLAQLSQLLLKGEHLFSMVLSAKTSKQLFSLFHINVSTFWLTHYRFEEISKKSNKYIGQTTIDLLIINAIVPTLFAYSKWKNDDQIAEQAIRLLQMTKGEHNRVTKKLKPLGFDLKHASDTQGALHLVQNYCNFKRCLQCPIGHAILKSINT